MTTARSDRLTRFAWIVLAYNMAVVLFGAVVRATGSGAGCGSDWPTCRGGVVPLSGTAETAIEFTHRASSGIALVLVGILVVGVLRSRPGGDVARLAAAASGLLILNEAFIGALLVIFDWVADDESSGRAISIALHLVNTFLLLGALALTAWWLGDGARPSRPLPAPERRLFLGAAAGLILVGAAGAITALGDTLFPSESLFEGIRDDFTGTFLVRLRWIHPILAVAVGLYLVWLVPRGSDHPRARRLGAGITWLVAIQLGAGLINVVLLAPVWMQLLHLLLADLLWIAFVLYTVETMAARQRAAAGVGT
jgi:heme A synthase